MPGWILRGVLVFTILIAALASRPLAPFGRPWGASGASLGFGALVALTALVAEAAVRRRDARVLGAAAMGAIVAGLAFSMLLRALPVLDTLRPFGYAVALWAGAACGAAWHRRPAPPPTREDGRILDTSAIIDGRIVDLVRTGVAPGPWLVPSFVLRELQQVADSDDPGRRARGRRGLEALERLRALPDVPLRVIEADPSGSGPVDDRLIALARRIGAALVTTDFNLVKVAGLSGVRVVNVHEIAQAMRGAAAPGEGLELAIVRAGKEPGQGVGYLDDGTMVVVEGAGELAGTDAEIVITGATQTASGRMLFAKLKP